MGENKTGKRLPPGAWNEIRRRYLNGEQSKALAAEFGIRAETLARRVTKERWKRPEELKTEAIKELEVEAKEDYKKLAKTTNDDSIKAYRFLVSISVKLMKDIHEGRLPNQAAYQLRVLADSMRIGLDGLREALRIEDINNPFDDTEVDMNSIERLRALMTPIDFKDIDFSQYHDEVRNDEDHKSQLN